MTDIIKDYEELSSQKVMAHLRQNPACLEKHLADFDVEVSKLGCRGARFVALGGDTHKIMSQKFGDALDIVKIPHYAIYIGKEKYREMVHLTLGLS
jgi:hypothetical protein